MNSIWKPSKENDGCVELDVRADNILEVIKFLRSDLQDNKNMLEDDNLDDETVYFIAQDSIKEAEYLINVLETMYMNLDSDIHGFHYLDAIAKVADNALNALGDAYNLLYNSLYTIQY